MRKLVAAPFVEPRGCARMEPQLGRAEPAGSLGGRVEQSASNPEVAGSSDHDDAGEPRPAVGESRVGIVVTDGDATDGFVTEARDQREGNPVRATATSQLDAPLVEVGVGVVAAEGVPVPRQHGLDERRVLRQELALDQQRSVITRSRRDSPPLVDSTFCGRGCQADVMEAQVLFAGVAVCGFEPARTWYERLFGRSPDVVAHEEEVMWRVTDGGWLYIVRDADHAGNGIVAVAVPDLEAAISGLQARGIPPGPVEPEGDAGLKAVMRDPDGNAVAFIQVAGSR